MDSHFPFKGTLSVLETWTSYSKYMGRGGVVFSALDFRSVGRWFKL